MIILAAILSFIGFDFLFAKTPSMPETPPHDVAIVENGDFEDSKRGYIGNSEDPSSPDTVNAKKFEFLAGDAPQNVNPSLWRQAQLNNTYGLFKVTDSVYQVRGFDISNMSIVEGKNGLIIIDPLTTKANAKAALELYYKYRSKRPISAVIYTHSHADHFGGVKGIVDEKDVKSGKVKIIAPEGFMEEAISENIFAGNAMSRRATYMYGVYLQAGEDGFVDEGLGKIITRSGGSSVSLIAPTVEITAKKTELTVDGVKMIFQLTPGTEAPAEMNVYFPQFKALNIAENSSKTLHNFYTLRGAKVRDSKAWAYYLDETIKKFGEAEVMFAGHHWPTWGREKIKEQLGNQRDEILFIHDQTLRLANMGLTPAEIADTLRVPEELYQYGYNRGYYGSVKHNSRGVYQYYLGYYDGNPVNLDPLPEAQAARKYLEYMGGSKAVLKKAKKDVKAGQYRFAALALNYVVLVEPENAEARELLASALEKMGYMAEAATWRNIYLSGAQELRSGLPKAKASTLSPDIAAAMTTPQFFDSLSLRVNPERVKGIKIKINWIFPDTKEKYVLILSNSVLRYEVGNVDGADFTVEVKRATLTDILSGAITLKDALEGVKFTGDKEKFKEIGVYFDEFDPNFKII